MIYWRYSTKSKHEVWHVVVKFKFENHDPERGDNAFFQGPWESCYRKCPLKIAIVETFGCNVHYKDKWLSINISNQWEWMDFTEFKGFSLKWLEYDCRKSMERAQNLPIIFYKIFYLVDFIILNS